MKSSRTCNETFWNLCGDILDQSFKLHCFNSVTPGEFLSMNGHARAFQLDSNLDFDSGTPKPSICFVFLSHSEVDSLVCFISCKTKPKWTSAWGWPNILSRYFLVKSQIHVSISCSKLSRSWSHQQPQTIALPPPCLTAEMIVVLKCRYIYTRCNKTHAFKKNVFFGPSVL